ncbi:MAG: hypothetical protein GY772_26510 [bacterium]|nr:hypothetical protein [bacterium]
MEWPHGHVVVQRVVSGASVVVSGRSVLVGSGVALFAARETEENFLVRAGSRISLRGGGCIELG